MRTRVIVVACSWAGLLACSSSSSSPSSSERLVDLSPSEVAALCDSLAQVSGGYGHTTTCREDAGVTMIESSKDQADCKAEVAQIASVAPGCPATVEQVTTCNAALVDCSRQGKPDPACQVLDGCSTPGSSSPGSSMAADAGGD